MKKIIIIAIMIGISLSLASCSETVIDETAPQVSSKEVEADFSLKEVEEEKLAEEEPQKEIIKEEAYNVEDVEEEYELIDPKDYVVDIPQNGEEPDIYDEAHGFTDVEDEEEPEGADSYEIDEAPPFYRINVRNLNVMTDVYDDNKNSELLRTAIQTYLDINLQDPGAIYNVELLEDTCKDGDIITFEVAVDELPGIILYVEYEKATQQYGIDSQMMDASLSVLKEDARNIE